MKAKKFSVIHLLMLVGLLIGCSETDHDVFNDVLSPSLLPSHESNPSLRPAVSVDTVAQPLPSAENLSPLPSTQEAVAAAPPILLAVVPIVSCGAAAFDVGTLFFGTPQFLSNHQMLFVGGVGMACPDGAILKSIKGIKILKSAKTLKNIKFRNFTRSKGAFRDNFERLIGRPVKPGYDVHHSIPRNNRADAKKLGINIEQPWLGIEIRREYHKSITDQYAKDWDTFFKQPNLTQSDVLLYQQDMLRNYGLKSGSYLELVK